MSAIRGKNTGPELLLRRALTRVGIRYRLHAGSVPGRPDIAFPSRKIAVFCDGDFWHGRNWATSRSHPEFKSRRDFWIPKIRRNIERDREVDRLLARDGWTVLRFWESDLERDVEVAVTLIRDTLEERANAVE